jgi:outer membrane protein TolC
VKRALTALLLFGAARAQAAPLTLHDAYQLALTRNPDLAATQENITQADAARKRARSALLPSLLAQGTYTRNQHEVQLDPKVFNPSSMSPPITIQALNTFSASARLHVPLFEPMGILGYVVSGTSQKVARLGQEQAAGQLMLGVAKAYYDLASAQEALAVAEQNRTVRAAHLEKQKVLLANGATVEAVVTQAELDLGDADGQILDAHTAVEVAEEELRVLCHLEGPVTIAPPEPPVAELEDEPKLIAEAARQRPDLKIAHIEADTRTFARWEARARYAPEISLDLSANWTNASGFTGRSFVWTGMLNATWLLFDGGGRSADSAARYSEVRAAELREQSASSRIGADIHHGLSQVRRARDRWQLAKHQAELTRANETAVKARFDAGGATPLELSDAEARRLTAEIAEVTSKNAYGLSLVMLDTAAGRNVLKR